MNEPVINISNIRKIYRTKTGGELEAIKNVDFSVTASEIVSVAGKSGCGKSTLLRIIANLLSPTTGSVKINPSNNQPMLIFQDFSRCLFPYMTVKENVGLALAKSHKAANENDNDIMAALENVGLENYVNFHPWELSGGMQQRVLIARAIASKPPCLLLDEPFASIDSLTRYKLEDLTRSLAHKYAISIIYVTHDIDSAIYCGDKIILLSPQPASILKEWDIPFGAKRDQLSLRGSSEFASFRTKCYEILSNA